MNRKLMRQWAMNFRRCLENAANARRQFQPQRADAWLIRAGRHVERAAMERDGGAQ
jgi:hypothetical protein